MEIYLGRIRAHDPLGMWWNSTEPRQWEDRPKFMIAADDLVEFCKLFLHYSGKQASKAAGFETITHLNSTMLLVDVMHGTNQHHSAKEYLRPAVKRLLEPLCHLHNIMLPIIECPAPKFYIDAVKQTIQRKAPSAQDLNLSLASALAEGYAFFRAGDFHSAALQYETAVDKFRAGSQEYSRNERMVEGRYAGAVVWKIKYVLLHRLELGLAKANFQLQHYEMAHRWTIAAELDFRDTEEIVSEMWYCRALASKALGEVERAYQEMDKALQKMPNHAKLRAEKAALSDLLPPEKRTH